MSYVTDGLNGAGFCRGSRHTVPHIGRVVGCRMKGVLVGEREHHRIRLDGERRRTGRSRSCGADLSLDPCHCCMAGASFRLQPLFSTSLKKIYQNTLGKNHCQPFHWHFWLTNSNNNFCFHLASHSSEKPLIVDKGPESPLPSDFGTGCSFFFKSLRNYPFGWYSISPNTTVSFIDLFYGHILQFLKAESFKGAKKLHFN